MAPPSSAPRALHRQKCQPGRDARPGVSRPQARPLCCFHRCPEGPSLSGLTGDVWEAGLWLSCHLSPHQARGPLPLPCAGPYRSESVSPAIRTRPLAGENPSAHQPGATSAPSAVLAVGPSKAFCFSLYLKGQSFFWWEQFSLIGTLAWVLSPAYPAPYLSQTIKREQEAAERNGLWTTQQGLPVCTSALGAGGKLFQSFTPQFPHL